MSNPVSRICAVFGAKLIIVKLLIEIDSTVTYVPCILEHVCSKPSP